MAHARTQIRDLLATRVTGLETCGDRVFKNRVKPLPQTSLPAINVMSGDEQMQVLSQGVSRRLGRVMQVHFDLIADADSDGAADTLDTIAAEIEAAIGAGYRLTDNVNVKAGLYNVANKEVTNDSYGVVLDGRRLTVGMTVDF